MFDSGKTLIIPSEDGAPVYWLYPDGSHRGLTAKDGGAINAMMGYMNVALDALSRIRELSDYAYGKPIDVSRRCGDIAKEALSHIEDGETYDAN